MTTPATDAQLQQLAQHGAMTWGSSVNQNFYQQWRPGPALSALLSGVTAAPRLAVWTEIIQHVVEDGRHDVSVAVAQYQTQIAPQAYAALEALNPRPTDVDVAPGAASDQLVAGVIAGTAAGQAAAAAVAAVDARIQDLAGRAVPLENLRATLDAECAAVSAGMNDRLARLTRMRAAIDASGSRLDLLLAIPVDVWDEQQRASAALSVMELCGSKADQALGATTNGTLADQEAAVTTAYSGPTQDAAGEDKALAAVVESVAEIVVDFVCTPPPPFNVAFSEFVNTYASGMAVYQALQAKGLNMAQAFHVPDGYFGGDVMDVVCTWFPLTVPEQTLIDVLTYLIDSAVANPQSYATWAGMAVRWGAQNGYPKPAR